MFNEFSKVIKPKFFRLVESVETVVIEMYLNVNTYNQYMSTGMT